MKFNSPLALSIVAFLVAATTACERKTSTQSGSELNKSTDAPIQNLSSNPAPIPAPVAPRIALDTNSDEFMKVIKFSVPTFSSKPISKYEEEFLSWFSSGWRLEIERISQEVVSIQDVQMRSNLHETKLNALKNSDLSKHINEAKSNWSIYKTKVINEHANDIAELFPYSSYSPQDETVNYKYKLPIKDMDTIYYKIKTKHDNLIKEIIQRRTEGRILELAVFDQEFAPGGRQHFQERIWPEVENEVRQKTLVFAYSRPNKELYLIDRHDMEIYYKWSEIPIALEDSIVGKILFDQKNKDKELINPKQEINDKSNDEG